MKLLGLFETECSFKIRRLPTKRQILDMLEQDEYIKAIKLHREKTGKGLKYSRDYIDRLCKQHRLCKDRWL
jgi:ribosomal protein L7/L12